ncbi:MAG TPA: hypothetical protein VGO11_05520 [Chthoniobacteraceae bacterium]|jgi:hypothetical protein|nr:hypothetical protein [Chthoniobacteraceae bacterium]
MIYRLILCVIAALLIFSPQAKATTGCPLCGGKLAKISSLRDNPSKPSRNLAVWNRSVCGNLGVSAKDVMCTRCAIAHFYFDQQWRRSSELPASFWHPLADSIRKFPLPSRKSLRSAVVYTQQYKDGRTIEEIAFWCRTSPEVIKPLRKYARTQGLWINGDKPEAKESETFVQFRTEPDA